MVGHTVKDSPILNEGKIALCSITSMDKEILAPVSSDEFIIGGDRIVCQGPLSTILALREHYELATSEKHRITASEMSPLRKTKLALVLSDCPLIGKTIGTTDFELQNHIIIWGISRTQSTISQSPRQTPIQQGDLLLVDRKVKGHNHPIQGLEFQEIASSFLTRIKKFLGI